MKTLLLLTLAASAVQVLAEPAIPEPYAVDRYEETGADSPFALATPPVAGPEPEPERNLLTDLYITGISQKDGKDYLMVRDSAEDRSFKLIGNEQNPAGIYVESVTWGNRADMVSAVVRHGAHRKEIIFKKENQAVQMRPPNMMGMQGMQPGAPGAPGTQNAPGGRFNNRTQVQQPQSIIPSNARPQNAPGAVVPPGGRSFTPATPRGAGTQSIGGGVPRPGGQGFRGGTVTPTNTPNSGPARQRDRGTIRNGRN
jgi:hypothetical protein